MVSTSPLGLPEGSVRAVIALAFVGVTAFLFGTTGNVPEALLGFTGLVVGHYFGTRASAGADGSPLYEDPEIDPPYVEPTQG